MIVRGPARKLADGSTITLSVESEGPISASDRVEFARRLPACAVDLIDLFNEHHAAGEDEAARGLVTRTLPIAIMEAFPQ
jgi:hypothetical protein